MNKKRSNQGARKLLCMLLAVVMVIAFIPGGFARPDSVSAEDTRIKVTEVEATSNIGTILGYGKEIKKPTFNVINGTEAYVEIGMSKWRKLDAEGKWQNVYNGKFGEGTWQYLIQLRVDGAYGTTHVLDSTTTMKVDGVDWGGNTGGPSVGSNFSYTNYYSPPVTITAPVADPLVFSDSESFDIPSGSVGSNIIEVDVSNAAIGGTTPYTFSKVSGPEWLNVSASGKITGTRPSTAQAATTVTIQVQDYASNTATIEINVGAVIERTKVTEVEATSNISTIFGYGKEIKNPTFNITKGNEAYVEIGMSKWQKLDAGGQWQPVTTGNFEEGTWRYLIQLRVDGAYGATHMLDSTTTMKVDGVDWGGNTGGPSVGSNYSYTNYYSPARTISKVFVLNGNADCALAAEGCKVNITANPAPAGKMFDKWEVFSGEVTLADSSKSTTTFTMPSDAVGVEAIYRDIPAPESVSLKLYGHDDIYASWSKVTGATGYQVEYYKSGSSTKYTKTVTGTSIKLPNLTDGVKYYVKVTPYVEESGTTNKGELSKSSSVYTLKKLNTPKVNKYSSSKVKVTWNNIAGESGYQISKSTTKSKTGTIYTVKTTSGKSKVLSVKKKKTYYYKVRAYKTVDGKKIYAPWSSVKSYKLK